MSLRDYAAWWERHKAGVDARLLYLKDWHFVAEFPEYEARIFIKHTQQPAQIPCEQQPWSQSVMMRQRNVSWGQPSEALDRASDAQSLLRSGVWHLVKDFWLVNNGMSPFMLPCRLTARRLSSRMTGSTSTMTCAQVCPAACGFTAVTAHPDVCKTLGVSNVFEGPRVFGIAKHGALCMQRRVLRCKQQEARGPRWTITGGYHKF